MQKFNLNPSIITGIFMLMGSLTYGSEINLQEGKEYISKFYIKEIIQEVAPTTEISNQDNQVDATTETIPKAEIIKSRINSLLKTWEGCLIYVGWDDGKKCDYNISILTKEEKDRAIESGITILSEVALSEEADIICSETLAGYFYAKQEYKKAIYWALHGAENGSSLCMVLLADAYRTGIGVVQSFEESLKWTYLGSAMGDKSCQKWVKEYGVTSITNEYLDPIVKEAKLRANKWMLNHRDIFISAE